MDRQAAGLIALSDTLREKDVYKRQEQAKQGRFTSLSTKYGPMSCGDGVAEIGRGGKSGKSSLRMFGGQDTDCLLYTSRCV